MCPKLIELLFWNSPTVHFCCFMLARASTKTFVSRVQENSEKIFVSRKIRYQGHSLAEVSLYLLFALLVIGKCCFKACFYVAAIIYANLCICKFNSTYSPASTTIFLC